MKQEHLILLGVGVLGYFLWQKTQVNRSLGGRVIPEGESGFSNINGPIKHYVFNEGACHCQQDINIGTNSQYTHTWMPQGNFPEGLSCWAQCATGNGGPVLDTTGQNTKTRLRKR